MQDFSSGFEFDEELQPFFFKEFSFNALNLWLQKNLLVSC